MHQKIFRLLERHLSFTKYIFRLYYSHVIKGAISDITLRNGLENTINSFADKDTCTGQGDSYLLDGDTAIEIDTYVEAARSVITNLEENLAFILEYNSPLKIMPLGDSITYGVIGTNDVNSGGYRTELWNKFVADGLEVEFVGSQFNVPESLGNKAHEGHPGWRIRRIARSVNKWLDASQPDLVLLMIGTNDTRKSSLKTMINELSALIDQITAHSPNTRLLVASIPPVHPAARPMLQGLRTIYFNTAIPSIVNSKVAQGKKVDFVDMRSLTVSDLTASLSLDLDKGLHPNAQGYRKIANFWHDAILRVTSNRPISSSSACYQIPTIDHDT